MAHAKWLSEIEHNANRPPVVIGPRIALARITLATAENARGWVDDRGVR